MAGERLPARSTPLGPPPAPEQAGYAAASSSRPDRPSSVDGWCTGGEVHLPSREDTAAAKARLAALLGEDGVEEATNPFEYSDVVTTTTHKNLRGPRSGMIFYRKGPKPPKKGQPEGALYDYEDKINFAVFPSLQGGPHNHQIAALAIGLKQAMQPGFKAYIQQVKDNAVAIANHLMSKGYKLVTDHSNKVEKVCDLSSITLNKNAVFGDSSALSPGGVRIDRGVPPPGRGHLPGRPDAAGICLDVQMQRGKRYVDFIVDLEKNKDITELRAEVQKFAISFEMPGFQVSSMKYKD
ncbi:hypothetical protein ACQ4PT_027531 [Festuca glaucescens]